MVVEVWPRQLLTSAWQYFGCMLQNGSGGDSAAYMSGDTGIHRLIQTIYWCLKRLAEP